MCTYFSLKLKHSTAAFVVLLWNNGFHTSSKKPLCVCNRYNEEVYLHVLRGWLCWDMAQRTSVSTQTPTRADQMKWDTNVKRSVVSLLNVLISFLNSQYLSFLHQLLLSGNLLWDSSGRRTHSAVRRHDPLCQQWRPGVQSSLCISREHETPPLPHACWCKWTEQTHTRGGWWVHFPEIPGAEQHVLHQEPKQVQQREDVSYPVFKVLSMQARAAPARGSIH